VSPHKQTAPKARQRSGANVSGGRPSTSEKIPPFHAPVNVLVGEIVKRDDGAQVIAARAAEMDWTLARLDESDAPRIRDIDLAERLGFERPRDIRKIIERQISLGNISPSSRATVARKPVGPKRGGEVEYTVTEYWLTLEEALFIATQSETKRAVFITKVMIAVFAAVMRGAAVSRENLPPEVTSILADYRRELEATRSDLAAHRQENAALMKLIGASGRHRAEQLKRVFNEVAALNAAAQRRSYRSCRTEVESLVRDRAGYPRGGSMRLEDMPVSTWEMAKIYANQELHRARRLSGIARQQLLSVGAA
jgi:hypothetical protein